MVRLVFTILLVFGFACSWSQPKQVSFGVFSGITVPFTIDQGINNDSRYQPRYEVKLAPVGVVYGVDHQGYGFIINPSIINIGQNFNVLNTVGGFEGKRRIDMQYLQVPIGLKLHVIDLSFFKVSLIGGISGGFLLSGKETISHNYAKYRFPTAVYSILPEDYVVEYDGVVAPAVSDLAIVETKDFNKIQLFGSFGFRSDWDFVESWRISLDVRATYGILETRTDEHLTAIEADERIYEQAGKRRDAFAYLNIGIARYIEIDKTREHRKKSSRRFKPKSRLPVQRPRIRHSKDDL